MNTSLPTPLFRAALSATLFLVLNACSEDEGPSPGNISASADGAVIETGSGSDDVGELDTTTSPDVSVSTDADAATADLPADAPAQPPDNGPLSADTIQWDVDTAEPQPGETGYPCATADDCNSLWCVPSSQGLVCSQTCVEACPLPGWKCVGVTTDSGNPAFVCLDQTTALCNPCQQNKDCNPTATNAPNLCMNMGDAGSFCGLNCGQSGTSCPPGYDCTEVPGATSVSRYQCMPAAGAQCDCNAYGQLQGATTQCNVVVDGVGACPGVRSCGPSGLGQCSGQTPQDEVCNGVDDNCDGNIDEGVVGEPCELNNNFGTCPGVFACGGEVDQVCIGTMPAADVCNGLDDDCDGITDKGFPDFDQDNLADCVDPDDDNDNTPDIDDCAPYDPSIGLFAGESCDGVDNNCNGLTDEEGAGGCTDYWQDADVDGYGSDAAGPKCLCGPDPSQYYTATQDGDCNDLAASAFPGGNEICNGIDDDCDGLLDEDLAIESPCSISNAVGVCQGSIACVQGIIQCIGQTPQPEVCNALDDDCNGQTDDTTADYDNDGDPDCTDPDDDNDNFLDEDDCQPLNENAYPGAQETCDGSDTNCNGVIDDEDATGCVAHYQDADGDGYGSDLVAPKCLCGPDNATYFNTTDAGDCNDIKNSVNPVADEVCNGIDDNCNASIDEGVTSPCGDCSSVCVVQTGETGDEGDFEPNPDNSSGLTTTPDGGLTLDSSILEIPFIWIANSGASTVSKLNTETGAEVGRYAVCGNPSRTAVDTTGNGIVAGRYGGCVIKIAVFETDCVDTNGNNQIDTSRDLNNDKVIDNSEMVANDECILWNVVPDGSSGGCKNSNNNYTQGCPRAAGVDADGDVWVGMWNSRRLYELDAATGNTKSVFDLSDRPYGLAIDGDQNIWLASRDNAQALMLVDPFQGQLNTWYMPSGAGYGLAIDPFGNIWMASGEGQGIHRFNVATQTFDYSSGNLDRGNGRGVAVSVVRDASGSVTESKVYLAHHTWGESGSYSTRRYVSIFNIDPDTQVVSSGGVIDLSSVNGAAPDGVSRGAVGVALDRENNLWAINQSSSTASKVDTSTDTVIGEYDVGAQPYTYSDMSGYALKTITAPGGFFRTVYNGWPGAATLWDKVIVDATLPGDGISRMEIRYRTADTELGLSGSPWVGPFGPFPPDTFPLNIGIIGNVFELEIRLVSEDPAYVPVVHDVSVIAYEQEN